MSAVPAGGLGAVNSTGQSEAALCTKLSRDPWLQTPKPWSHNGEAGVKEGLAARGERTGQGD